MSKQKKIEEELKKIGNLKIRIERLINNREKKILDIKEEFDSKVNTVYTLIELAKEKIRVIRMQSLEDKEVPKELEYDFGIDWIHGDTLKVVPISFKKIDEAEEYLNEERELNILEGKRNDLL